MNISVLSICQRCFNKTAYDGQKRVNIAGLTQCYFCGEEVVTGCLNSYLQVVLEDQNTDEILIVTKVYDGIHLFLVNAGEVCFWEQSEIKTLPEHLYIELVAQGMI